MLLFCVRLDYTTLQPVHVQLNIPDQASKHSSALALQMLPGR